MRVNAWVGEVMVDVSIESFLDEIENMDEGNGQKEAKRLLNACIGVIKRIPDAIIIAMDEPSRGLIATALKRETERYEIKINDRFEVKRGE